MIDLHLINMTMVGMGIGVAVVLVIAAALIAAASIRPHKHPVRPGHATAAPAGPAMPEALAPREPALR